MASFNGVNFDLRNVRALDDARIRDAQFTDGILRGCALTFSGADLTIAKGAYIFKGREVAVDSDTTLTTIPTYSSGYGRLKYVIDLSQAASESTFTQGSTVWQYASTNSFAALTQEDINDGVSALYEVELCRVQYASGSITAITSKISDYGNKPITIRNASGKSRGRMYNDSTNDTCRISLSDSTESGIVVGTNASTDGVNKYRGIWLYGSSVSGIVSNFGHNTTDGNTYLWMKHGDGTSAVRQIYIESTPTGGAITLRNAAGVVGAEIIFDATAGGQIKLYRADGTLKQTIG